MTVVNDFSIFKLRNNKQEVTIMKHINNFFVKIGYGIGCFLYFLFCIVYVLIDVVGFKLLFLYFVTLPLSGWIEIETIQDIGEILRKYSYGVSAGLVLIPKWWEDTETKEAITFWEFVGTCIKKSSTELDQWYDKKIKK